MSITDAAATVADLANQASFDEQSQRIVHRAATHIAGAVGQAVRRLIGSEMVVS